MRGEHNVMITTRLPGDLVERVDFVATNADSETIVNRSAAVRDALENWLPNQEQKLRELGIEPPTAEQKAEEARQKKRRR